MSDLQPKPTEHEPPLLDTPLIPEPAFHDKLRAIFSVPKAELDQHMREHPDPPAKRGRKPIIKQKH